jgi:hypothetical protein
MLLIVFAILCLGGIIWHVYARPTAPVQPVAAPGMVAAPNTVDDRTPTTLYAHNIRLRKGPDFRIYIRWIHGQMLRLHEQVIPSFDDPDSFVLHIQKGVVRANIGDIAHYLNMKAPPDAPFKNISVEPDGDLLKVKGTVHKLIPMPVELEGHLAVAPDGRVVFHTTKINALKIPVKGLLGGFHLELSDLVKATKVPGVELSGNDILFNTQTVLPPPHIRGELTSLTVKPPDIEAVYGNAPYTDAQLAKWHNFLRLSGGTVGFGKLTMHHVDLTLIDASQDPWFDLDLVNYQAQVVNGYTRITEQAGLEIFMPDLQESGPPKVAQRITVEWLKNRYLSVPADIPVTKQPPVSAQAAPLR